MRFTPGFVKARRMATERRIKIIMDESYEMGYEAGYRQALIEMQ